MSSEHAWRRFLQGGLFLSALAFLVVIPFVPASNAQETVHLQGRITDSVGNPVHEPAGATLTIRVYEIPVGGTALWVEDHASPLVPVVNGVFSVLIGTGVVQTQPLGGLRAVFPLSADRFIGVSVNGATELPERIRAASAAIALNAFNAQEAAHASASDKAFKLDVSGAPQPGTYFLNLDHMTAGTIKPGQIASGAVQASHIAGGQINASHLASVPLIGNVHISDNAVTGSKIVDGGRIPGKLALSECRGVGATRVTKRRSRVLPKLPVQPLAPEDTGNGRHLQLRPAGSCS